MVHELKELRQYKWVSVHGVLSWFIIFLRNCCFLIYRFRSKAKPF
jgi:hypothetical protein